MFAFASRDTGPGPGLENQAIRNPVVEAGPWDAQPRGPLTGKYLPSSMENVERAKQTLVGS